MSNDTMLYKCPGPYAIHGGNYDYTIVDADDESAFNAALEAGWLRTTPEAKEAYDAAQAALAAQPDASAQEASATAPETPAKASKAAKAAW